MKNKISRVHLVHLLAFPVMAISATGIKAQPQIPAPTAQQTFERARDSRMESMRTMMRIYDLEDKNLQDTLTNFLTEQAAARRNVREQKRTLLAGMRNNLASDAQILSLLNEYRATAERAKEDYDKALLALDAKINYSKNPRLEAILVVLGIIGDEEWVGNGPANFGIYADPPKAQPVAPPANPQ